MSHSAVRVGRLGALGHLDIGDSVAITYDISSLLMSGTMTTVMRLQEKAAIVFAAGTSDAHVVTGAQYWSLFDAVTATATCSRHGEHPKWV